MFLFYLEPRINERAMLVIPVKLTANPGESKAGPDLPESQGLEGRPGNPPGTISSVAGTQAFLCLTGL